MKKEKIILQLGVEIDTLKAHIQRLKKVNYQLHQLDVELLQQKVRQLYDMLFELEGEVGTRNIASTPTRPEADSITETPQPKEKVVAKPPKKIIESPQPATKKAEEKIPEKLAKEIEVVQEKGTLEVVETEVVPEEIKPEPEAIIEPPQAKTEISIDKQAEVKTNFDLFSDSSKATISDKFTGQDEQSLADKMQQTKVTDLRQSVGINEKFLFINELFNGDLSRYNKVIDELNELTTLKGVQTFLLEIKVQNQWDDELEAYLKLKDLAERKFI